MSPNALIFTDHASGSPHGYVFDSWVDAGDGKCFLYTGEGQRGDQQLIRGNAAILNRRQEGRALRLFEGAGGSNVRYVGRFSIDDGQWYIEREAPETGGGPTRSVLVFRLKEVPDRANDELFEDAWEQLRTYLTQARELESLVEQKRYQLDSFTETAINYTRTRSGRNPPAVVAGSTARTLGSRSGLMVPARTALEVILNVVNHVRSSARPS
jgi:hypothetical protein